MKLSNLKNKLEQLRKMVKEPFEKPVFAQSATFSSTCNEVIKLSFQRVYKPNACLS